MKSVLFASFLFFIVLFGCTNTKKIPDQVLSFVPAQEALSKGIVNKYYVHSQSLDQPEVASNIEYRSYQLVDGGRLEQFYYDPAMKPSRFRIYNIQDSEILLESDESYWYGDTIKSEILAPSYMRFEKGSTSVLEKQDKYRYQKKQQLAIRDTVILGKPSWIVESNLSVVTVGDSNRIELRIMEYFVEGLGLFEASLESESWQMEMELVKQFTLPEFQKMADHAIERVGYIDSTQTLFPDPNFKTCQGIHHIADYYNGEPDAGYPEGATGLKQHLLPLVDSAKLGKESGYLTFRFVINCEGETGWFVTEMANLDFREYSFSESAIQHLGKLLSDVKGWKPTIIRGQQRDSYAYITFKLQEGEIIDVLP